MKKLKLNLEKPVVLYPQLAKALGGIEEAIYWQQLYYWSDKGKDNWIYKTKKEIEEETALTRYQQDRVRKKLEKIGAITTLLKKANGSPTLHFKVDIGIVRNLLMEKQETYYSNSKKLTNPSYTENTTENTTENSKAKALQTNGKEINDLIDLFKKVNPSYQRLFGNKTQRSALERLVKQHGQEKIEWAIKVLSKTNKMKYFPTICTPLDLENKLGTLIACLQKGKSEKINIEI